MAVATKTVKSKALSQAERIAEFKRENVIPFPGTFEKPYELSKVADDDKKPRPTAKDILNNMPSLEEYLKNPQSAVTIYNCHVIACLKDSNSQSPLAEFESAGFFIIVNPKNGFCCGTEERIPFHALSYERVNFLLDSKVKNRVVKNVPQDLPKWAGNDYEWPDVDEEVPAGWFIDNKLLLNADEEANDWGMIGNDPIFDKFACLSFGCLVNLIAKRVIDSRLKKFEYLTEKNLKIVDFSPAKIKDTTKALRENCSKARKTVGFSFKSWAAFQTPPEFGFSLLDQHPLKWHKSATVLIQNGKESYLMGQDDGTYFGCVLADNPSTLQKAFISLTPLAARNVKGVIRQGEWFAIPVKDQKSVPDKYSEKTLLWTESSDCLTFPIEDKDSNLHQFTYGTVIVTASGFFAKDFTISHDEHPELCGKRGVWYFFAKNTALHSFSAEKVD